MLTFKLLNFLDGEAVGGLCGADVWDCGKVLLASAACLTFVTILFVGLDF